MSAPATGSSGASRALTPERLFGEPPLLAGLPQQARFTHDGKRLLFLNANPLRRDWLDLWSLDCGSDQPAPTAPWLTATDLADYLQDAATEESEAERAERERKRQFAGGIASFQLRPSHAEVLVVCGGQALLVDLADRRVRRLTQVAERHIGFKFSPGGRYLSFVRANDLYYLDLTTDQEQRVSQDGCATVASGLADFIAQEEMHRFDGHWWAPDDSAIAFQRTDESPIPVTERHDITAHGIDLVEQRYPYAGGANATVALGVYQLAEQSTRWLDYQSAEDDYLARVDWFESGLWLQVQDRAQQRLTLGRYRSANWHWQQIHEETSDSWVNLHDNLRPLAGSGQAQSILWTTEQDGGSQLLRINFEDSLEPRLEPRIDLLSPPGLYVEAVIAVTESAAFVTGWDETPTERHLFRIELNAPGPAVSRLTEQPGWHEPTGSKDGKRFVDRASSLDQPPHLVLLEPEHKVHRPLYGGSAESQPYGEFLPQHRRPQLGELQADDGSRLCYRLTRPGSASSDNPVPVIVHVYGGPGVQRVRNEWASLMLQLFTQHGFAVFELDNRGSSGRGRAFEAPIHRAMGTVELADQLRGVDFLHTLNWVRQDRIGLFGHSYGGYMTLRGLTRSASVFAAGVSVAPVTDWALYDTHYTERYLGLPQDPDACYTRAGILGELNQLTAPLLLMHGMADDNVLFAHSVAAMAELQEAGVDFDLMTYPGSKHALQETPVAIHRFQKILKFFEQHLKR